MQLIFGTSEEKWNLTKGYKLETWETITVLENIETMYIYIGFQENISINVILSWLCSWKQLDLQCWFLILIDLSGLFTCIFQGTWQVFEVDVMVQESTPLLYFVLSGTPSPSDVRSPGSCWVAKKGRSRKQKREDV